MPVKVSTDKLACAFRFRDYRPMAGRAFLRRWLVKQHRFATHRLNVLVARFAAHSLMRSLQGKARAALVIEQ